MRSTFILNTFARSESGSQTYLIICNDAQSQTRTAMNNNDDDDNDDAAMVVRTPDTRGPAYGLMAAGPAQSQCSGNDAFCFMCAFESSATEDDADAHDGDDANDHPSSLRSLVRALVAQRRETYQIIHRVWEAYEKNVRQDVRWARPDGTIVNNPAWSMEAVKRHLLTSPEFQSIFMDCVENVFTNIVMAQNNVIIDRESGHADPEAVDNFIKTVKAMCAYKESRARLKTSATRSGPGTAGKRSR